MALFSPPGDAPLWPLSLRPHRRTRSLGPVGADLRELRQPRQPNHPSAFRLRRPCRRRRRRLSTLLRGCDGSQLMGRVGGEIAVTCKSTSARVGHMNACTHSATGVGGPIKGFSVERVRVAPCSSDEPSTLQRFHPAPWGVGICARSHANGEVGDLKSLQREHSARPRAADLHTRTTIAGDGRAESLWPADQARRDWVRRVCAQLRTLKVGRSEPSISQSEPMFVVPLTLVPRRLDEGHGEERRENRRHLRTIAREMQRRKWKGDDGTSMTGA